MLAFGGEWQTGKQGPEQVAHPGSRNPGVTAQDSRTKAGTPIWPLGNSLDLCSPKYYHQWLCLPGRGGEL